MTEVDVRSQRQLRIPPLYTPFSPAIHPHHEAVSAHTRAWAERYRIGSPALRGQLVNHDIGTFAARILPEGREEVVEILADFVLWLFGVDDGHCEVSEVDGGLGPDFVTPLGRLLRVAQAPHSAVLPEDALADGLRDLRARLDQWATPSQLARWIHALREYFYAVTWEAAHRGAGTVPTVDDYTVMRLHDGATSVVLPLLEAAYGYELPSGEGDQERVRALEEMAFFVICWDNDLFSHHKEAKSGDYYLNIVRVLEWHHGLSAHEALVTAISQRDRVLCRYLEVSAGVRATASPRLRRYLDSLDAFIRAGQDWGISSIRYTTPDDPAALPNTFSATPTDDDPAPLDIPSITWWWQSALDGERTPV
ncbi:terpene synthase [Streptomyces sp. AJS327]|uniref:selina-4(15),7(11)-diene synthase n=1 Tax=Streptomyces sp. AJS327 TaxID=2545265 RepID=UPI0015DF51AC|nr:selina-4(15),7(11)-diene synthase [Streptomyces sp. AJS327]MBA0052762.1 terpene synthase [Streptomyces sp. AJS327]